MTLPVEINPHLLGSLAADYQIERSLRFNSADSAYLNRTPASASNRETWTWSGWVKRTIVNTTGQNLFSTDNGSSTTLGQLFFNDDWLEFNCYASSAYQWRLITTQVWRDLSAWYHIVAVLDTTQATSSNRVKLYVNGTQITAFSTATYPSQGFDGAYNLNQPHYIGAAITSSGYLNGYLTEVNFIDGQALTPSSFGETDSATGVWKPKAFSGTYGTNGFFLKFADNSGTTSTTLGKDSSGNGNNWTPNNFSVTAGAGNDSLVDSPTSYGTDTGVGGTVRSNYATWNPLDKDDGITSVTNGNLNVVTNGSNGSIKSTIAFPSGKWYWEVTSDTIGGAGTQAVGIIPQSQPPTNNMSDIGKLGYALDVSFSDRKFENGTATSYGTYTQANGAIYMLAFDQTSGKLWYGINGTWLASGDPATGTNASSSSIPTTTSYCAAVSDNTVSATFTVNFGQRAFAYTAPSGFKALCTQNLPPVDIGATSTTQANKYMDVTLYTGNGAVRSITNSGSMQPDFVWDKLRSGANSHRLFDAVRGVEKALYSNLTNSETNETGTLTAFNSNGFSLGTNTETNTNGSTYVAWQWNAGGSTVTNTSGTISSQVRASTTSGFSIVTYTGTLSVGTNPSPTVGHGLGVAPSLIISKSRNVSGVDTGAWHVNHVYNYNNYLRLNTTAAGASISGNGGGTPANPTNTVFSAYYLSGSCITGNDYVAYCFAAVPGYSAFGSYTGNGSADGPFIFTNMRPKYLLFKRTDSTSQWRIYDSVRSTYNEAKDALYATLSDAEAVDSPIDFLSNGFKMRTTDTAYNASGGTYIYAAFAESPFKYSLAR